VANGIRKKGVFMSNIKQQMPMSVMDALSNMKTSAQGIEGLLFLMCDALKSGSGATDDYLAAAYAIHAHSSRHIELLGILESELNKLHKGIEE